MNSIIKILIHLNNLIFPQGIQKKRSPYDELSTWLLEVDSKFPIKDLIMIPILIKQGKKG